MRDRVVKTRPDPSNALGTAGSGQFRMLVMGHIGMHNVEESEGINNSNTCFAHESASVTARHATYLQCIDLVRYFTSVQFDTRFALLYQMTPQKIESDQSSLL